MNWIKHIKLLLFCLRELKAMTDSVWERVTERWRRLCLSSPSLTLPFILKLPSVWIPLHKESWEGYWYKSLTIKWDATHDLYTSSTVERKPCVYIRQKLGGLFLSSFIFCFNTILYHYCLFSWFIMSYGLCLCKHSGENFPFGGRGFKSLLFCFHAQIIVFTWVF